MPEQIYAETRVDLDSGGRDRAGHRRHHRSARHRVEPARAGRLLGELARARPSAESICAALLRRPADRARRDRRRACQLPGGTGASHRSATAVKRRSRPRGHTPPSA
jgi:hypothetical protein